MSRIWQSKIVGAELRVGLWLYEGEFEGRSVGGEVLGDAEGDSEGDLVHDGDTDGLWE